MSSCDGRRIRRIMKASRQRIKAAEPKWTQERLNQACLRWQKILRIQDWDVQAKFVPYDTWENAGTWGDCCCHGFKRKAWIRILDPNTPEMGKDHDIELTLIHELVHVLYAPDRLGMDRERNPEAFRFYEEAVDITSCAFRRLADVVS